MALLSQKGQWLLWEYS